MDHGIGKVFEADVLGAWAGSLQFGWGECRGRCIMGHVCEHALGLLGHNIVRGQWDSRASPMCDVGCGIVIRGDSCF
jgi:hypothetical protein